MKNPPETRLIPVWYRKRRTTERLYACAAVIYFHTGIWPPNPLGFSPLIFCVHAASSSFRPGKHTHQVLERRLNHHG